MIDLIRKFFGSAKLAALIGGVIVNIAALVLTQMGHPVSVDQINELIMAYCVGQGIADVGKNYKPRMTAGDIAAAAEKHARDFNLS